MMTVDAQSESGYHTHYYFNECSGEQVQCSGINIQLGPRCKLIRKSLTNRMLVSGASFDVQEATHISMGLIAVAKSVFFVMRSVSFQITLHYSKEQPSSLVR